MKLTLTIIATLLLGFVSSEEKFQYPQLSEESCKRKAEEFQSQCAVPTRATHFPMSKNEYNTELSRMSCSAEFWFDLYGTCYRPRLLQLLSQYMWVYLSPTGTYYGTDKFLANGVVWNLNKEWKKPRKFRWYLTNNEFVKVKYLTNTDRYLYRFQASTHGRYRMYIYNTNGKYTGGVSATTYVWPAKYHLPYK